MRGTFHPPDRPARLSRGLKRGSIDGAGSKMLIVLRPAAFAVDMIGVDAVGRVDEDDRVTKLHDLVTKLHDLTEVSPR